MYRSSKLASSQPMKHAVTVFELKAHADEFVAETTSPNGHFDPSQYSKFKYGRRDHADYYGTLLAEALKPHLEKLAYNGEAIAITGTPYKQLPNAARLLAGTAERLLRATGLPTSYAHMYQHRLAEGDYGLLSSTERDKRNRQKLRFFDPEDFSGKHVVVVDDIRITGSIERSITALLADVPTRSITIANLVKLDPATALEQPQLEDKLNHYAVRNLRDVLSLTQDGQRFRLITRTVKYILESKPTELTWFLSQLNPSLIVELYEGIIDDGYDCMPRYYHAFKLVADARNQIAD